MKRLLCILLALFCIMSLVSCDASDKSSDKISDKTFEKTFDKISDKTSVEEYIPLKDAIEEIYVYYTDDMNAVYKTKVFFATYNPENDKEIDLTSLVEASLCAIDVFDIDKVSVDYDETSNSAIVNFSSEFPSLKMGTSGETQVLKTVALSLIMAGDVESVYYYVDGDVYSSGHYYLEPDGFYMSRDILKSNWDDLFSTKVQEVVN